MKTFFAILGVASAIIGFILGVWWLIWLLWTWVMPQIWPTGPDALVRPSYWLFAGIWVLISLIGKALFKSESHS